MTELTDAEVVCGFMEKRPAPEHFDPGTLSVGGWWWTNAKGKWEAWDCDSLDRLHLAEAKLTDAQRQHYLSHVASINGLVGKFYEDAWVYCHATAEQKLKALATVLRGAGAAH